VSWVWQSAAALGLGFEKLGITNDVLNASLKDPWKPTCYLENPFTAKNDEEMQQAGMMVGTGTLLYAGDSLTMCLPHTKSRRFKIML